MPDFPVAKTNAVDNVTDVLAKHINNLENKVGIDGDPTVTSFDYIIKKLIGEWTKQVFTGDNSTTEFTLTDSPIGGLVMVFYGGNLLIETKNFTIAAKVITTLFTAEDDAKIVVWYRKEIT